jgi:asparagine N-glycosylation enzyme membrane subunit Stt3
LRARPCGRASRPPRSLSLGAVSVAHSLACVASGLWTGGLAWLARRRADRSIARRLREAFAVAAVVALALAPALASGLPTAWSFVTKSDAWGERVVEQRPLFADDPSGPSALESFGYFAYAIPLAPLLCLGFLRDPRSRPLALVLAVWTGVLGALALAQVRYANDYAGGGAVLFAWILTSAVGVLRLRFPTSGRGAAAVLVALLVLLLWPAFRGYHERRIVQAITLLRLGDSVGDRALLSAHGSFLRFAQEIRRVTPATSGYLGAEGDPEYGVLCEPNLGYAIEYAAQRPTPVGNAGPYAGAANAAAVQRLLSVASEPEALRLLEAMRIRYVVTTPPRARESFLSRLHRSDGRSEPGEPRREHFRLVTEGPFRGVPFDVLLTGKPSRERAPYKLFEVVRGAVLEVPAGPGESVTASVLLRTPPGRAFRYRAQAQPGPDGVARLRVPYATRTALATRALAPYEIRSGRSTLHVDVTDAEVTGGAVIRVEPAP